MQLWVEARENIAEMIDIVRLCEYTYITYIYTHNYIYMIIYIYYYYINTYIYIWCNPQIHSTLPDLCNSGSPTSPHRGAGCAESHRFCEGRTGWGVSGCSEWPQDDGGLRPDGFRWPRNGKAIGVVLSVGPANYSWQKLWISMESYGLMWINMD